MAGADLDYNELHLSIFDYFTHAPYVDTNTGLTTLDMPYEKIEPQLTMYEPRKKDVSTVKITLPSLIQNPEYRPLFQMLKDGNRVELYNFQPDSGDPVMAGYIVPDGITEEDGATILAIEDSITQGKWQRVRQIEELQTTASVFIQRGLSHWIDLVNDDFSLVTDINAVTLTQVNDGIGLSGEPATWLANPYPQVGNALRFYQAVGHGFGTSSQVTVNFANSSFNPVPGESYMFEFDYTLEGNLNTPSALPSVGNISTIELRAHFKTAAGAAVFGYGVSWTQWLYDNTFALPYFYGLRLMFPFSLYPQAGGVGAQYLAAAPDQGETNHVQVVLQISADGSAISGLLYKNNQSIQSFTASTAGGYPIDLSTWTPEFVFTTNILHTFFTLAVTNVRIRRLTQFVNKASRWNPQTQDITDYVPNYETCFDYMNLFVEQDNSEYRVLHRHTPQRDEVELDAVGTLGRNVSQALEYSEGANQIVGTSPSSAETDFADFLIAPPFRFEEGYNMRIAPKIEQRTTPHSNGVIRVGSNQLDAQVFAESYSVQEVGDPLRGIPPVYPYFEQVTNDDRIDLNNVAKSLANYDLLRGIDPTRAITVEVLDSVHTAWKWREGDTVWVSTKSLRNNVEGYMRIMKIICNAGSPVRQVTLGRIADDPSMIRELAMDMQQSWLYEQSGSNAMTLVYPFLPYSFAGVDSPGFTFAIDQFTQGTAIVAAYLHFFLSAGSAANITPKINGNPVGTANAGLDSGLMTITNYIPTPGAYTLVFNGASPAVLSSAFLVLRVKI